MSLLEHRLRTIDSMKSELRRAVGLPPLPPTVEEALADVSPAATVLVSSEESKAVQRLLGLTGGPKRMRSPMVRPAGRIGRRDHRVALSISWREVFEAGFAALEQDKG
jgi:hypothetical protein